MASYAVRYQFLDYEGQAMTAKKNKAVCWHCKDEEMGMLTTIIVNAACEVADEFESKDGKVSKAVIERLVESVMYARVGGKIAGRPPTSEKYQLERSRRD